MSDPNIAVNPPCQPLEDAPPITVGCVGSPVPQTLIGRLSMQTDDALNLRELVVANYVDERWFAQGDNKTCSFGHGLMCNGTTWEIDDLSDLLVESTLVSQQDNPFEVVMDITYREGLGCEGSYRITWTSV